jgi:predicted DNA-binding transcriptional regulator AlpA
MADRCTRVLRESKLHPYDGLGHAQRGKYIEQGLYPPPFKLSDGGRAKAWFESEILAYQRWRRARRDGTAAQGSLWRDYLDSYDAAAPATAANMGQKRGGRDAND